MFVYLLFVVEDCNLHFLKFLVSSCLKYQSENRCANFRSAFCKKFWSKITLMSTAFSRTTGPCSQNPSKYWKDLGRWASNNLLTESMASNTITFKQLQQKSVRHGNKDLSKFDNISVLNKTCHLVLSRGISMVRKL